MSEPIVLFLHISTFVQNEVTVQYTSCDMRKPTMWLCDTLGLGLVWASAQYELCFHVNNARSLRCPSGMQ